MHYAVREQTEIRVSSFEQSPEDEAASDDAEENQRIDVRPLLSPSWVIAMGPSVARKREFAGGLVPAAHEGN
jgi:hypothetical protein